ncbi:MafI family immunity protein [Tateyamaria sp. ANG-S1]|uniref:MafI family immunity protein n=1 Tax=Tateyamaria sp. ANG-S1 TaxID=1577905 RepID=UPI00057F8143|nr:MafI family immunity protein [Tateyamaria sp. ANG-S1]KIC47744.1 hypothetical protein RA29_19210 [Tateyamaria sp. ANG-S1]
MHETQQISVIQIIDQFEGRFGNQTLQDCREMAVAGEWGVAFEKLCDDLFEFDIVPTQADYDAIALTGEHMGLTPDRWNFLMPRGGPFS